MAAIERQLDILIQNQLLQNTMQQNQIQQNQVQQDEPHLNFQPGQILNRMPAEPAEERKSWEKLMDIVIESDQQPNPLTKLDSKIHQIMTKYVNKKLEKQKADYETKLKNLEEQIAKLKRPPPPPPAPTIDYASVDTKVCKEKGFLDELVKVVNNTWDKREKVEPAGIIKTLERKINRSEEARRLIFLHETFKGKYGPDYNDSKLQQQLYNESYNSYLILLNF